MSLLQLSPTTFALIALILTGMSTGCMTRHFCVDLDYPNQRITLTGPKSGIVAD